MRAASRSRIDQDRASSSPPVNGWPCILVTTVGVDEVLGPDEPRELPEVHLGHQHLPVAPQHVAEVAREAG